MRAYDAIFDIPNHNHLETLSGNVLAIPGLDDVANSSTLVGENTNPGPGSNFIASATQLNAFSFRSGFIFVTTELLQDSGVPIGALLEQAIAVRHARAIGSYMMIGSGVNQPRGLITAALANGAPVVVAQGDSFNNGIATENGSNSIGSEDMALLFGSLNSALRSEAIFAMNDATLIALRSTTDRVGRPILRYSNQDLTSIWGKRVIVSPSMAPIGPSAISIAFYVPRFYLMRHVTSGAYIRRTVEAPGCVERGAVAFQGYYRADGNLSVPNPLYPPIALLQNYS
jgi:HK97 family phage major capsid protein